MNLGTITLTNTAPTEEGWYYWANDTLCVKGKFVKVEQLMGGTSLWYLVNNDWVMVNTFQRSKWSKKLDFSIKGLDPAREI